MLLPLQQNNIQFKLMVQPGDLRPFLSGGAANHDANASLGGVISTFDMIADGVRHRFMDAVTAAEASSGLATYRCYYIKNTNATETWFGGEVWIETVPTGTLIYQIGLDPVGVGDGVSTGVAVTVASDTLFPAGVAFTAPSSSPGLSIGDLAAGEVQAVWVQRIISAGTSVAPDDIAVLRHSGTDY